MEKVEMLNALKKLTLKYQKEMGECMGGFLGGWSKSDVKNEFHSYKMTRSKQAL